ncbi:hypothetical protein C8R43DRAFT_826888, partial [Mycena crocata]
GLSTDNRPKEIGTWVKYARKGKPEIKDEQKLGVEWGKWWYTINPKWWCTGDVLSKATAQATAQGAWDELRKPGANGFLGLLIGLRWWGEGPAQNAEWSEALADVTWV